MASDYTLAAQKEFSQSFLQCKSPAQLASLLRMPHYKLRRVILYPGYRRKVIARASGKPRVLHIPGLRLKKVQRALNRHLQAVYYDLMPAQVHGFVRCPADGVRARNIVTNALPQVGKKVVTGIMANQKPNVNREYKRKLRAQLHTLGTLGPYMATCRNLRLREPPAHLVSRYLLTLEGKKKFLEMVGQYSHLTKSDN